MCGTRSTPSSWIDSLPQDIEMKTTVTNGLGLIVPHTQHLLIRWLLYQEVSVAAPQDYTPVDDKRRWPLSAIYQLPVWRKVLIGCHLKAHSTMTHVTPEDCLHFIVV